MADNLQTFKVISRGGLNTTGDVLSQGQDFRLQSYLAKYMQKMQ